MAKAWEDAKLGANAVLFEQADAAAILVDWRQRWPIRAARGPAPRPLGPHDLWRWDRESVPESVFEFVCEGGERERARFACRTGTW